MSSRIIKICDRCKKEEESYNADWEYVRNSGVTNRIDSDLCPECFKQLTKWLKKM